MYSIFLNAEPEADSPNVTASLSLHLVILPLMKHLYRLLTGIVLLCGVVQPAAAQYEFGTPANGLAPYKQNFDLPTLATTVTFASDGKSNNYPGVYARFMIGTNPTEFPASNSFSSLSAIPANDGTDTNTAWYIFGAAGSTERALGGIGGTIVNGNTVYPSGVGYIGIRLKNSSGIVIKNLEIKYAMEQWYNSSKEQSAQATVYYMRSTSPITTLSGPSYQKIDALTIQAPSTTTPIEERNGNSATNRRVAQTNLTGINLAAGEEIMIRFGYVFDATSNGNGLSVDDIEITPQTNIFYSSLTGDLENVNTWNTSPTGNGSKPATFSADNQIFYVQGTSLANRVKTGGNWTVAGTNSKIIVGIPASPGAAAVPASLLVDASTNKTIVGKIDVADGSTLRIDRIGATDLILGSLAATSTVEYNNTSGTHSIKPASYGNLVLSGSGSKSLGGDIIVNGTLNLSNTSSLSLGDFDASLLRPATVASYSGSVLNAGPGAYIITNGGGVLRQSVPNTGVGIVFPIGATTAYTPVLLQQPNSSTARNEDVFSVRILDGMYGRYNATTEGGVGTAITNQNVKKTWLVSEEVVGNSNVTMTLQWNSTDEVTGGAAGTNFDRTKAYVGHYLTSPQPYFDKGTVAAATAGTASTSWKVSRAGITSFSPFIVSSRASAPLPVQLVSFAATRIGEAVLCTWKTAAELNNARFVVERSRDGKLFEAIGSVQGQGTSTLGHSYTFNDTKAPATTTYYRLRQEDTDGTSTYSTVLVVAGLTGSVELAIVPNPGTGVFQVLGLSTHAGSPGVVRNILGAQVQRISAGGTFDLSTYPAGVYLVQIQTSAGLQTKRVVKQ